MMDARTIFDQSSLSSSDLSLSFLPPNSILDEKYQRHQQTTLQQREQRERELEEKASDERTPTALFIIHLYRFSLKCIHRNSLKYM